MFIGNDSPSGAHERERSSSSVRALLFSKRRDLLISSAEARPSEIFSERPSASSLVPMTFAAALPPRSGKGKSENLMRASIDFLSLKRNTLYRSAREKVFSHKHRVSVRLHAAKPQRYFPGFFTDAFVSDEAFGAERIRFGHKRKQ